MLIATAAHFNRALTLWVVRLVGDKVSSMLSLLSVVKVVDEEEAVKKNYAVTSLKSVKWQCVILDHSSHV